jgi:hypothetical protein
MPTEVDIMAKSAQKKGNFTDRTYSIRGKAKHDVMPEFDSLMGGLGYAGSDWADGAREYSGDPEDGIVIVRFRGTCMFNPPDYSAITRINARYMHLDNEGINRIRKGVIEVIRKSVS